MTKCQNEMRASGIRDVLIYCADYKCSNWIRVNTDQWSTEVRLSDLENQFTCTCGRKGAEVRPDFDWNTQLRSKTMREAFKRFVEGKPSGTAFVIGGRRATETRRGINK